MLQQPGEQTQTRRLLQTVAAHAPHRVNLCNQHLQCVLESIVQLHNGRLVATAIAVVGGTEDGHHIAFMTPIVALHLINFFIGQLLYTYVEFELLTVNQFITSVRVASVHMHTL